MYLKKTNKQTNTEILDAPSQLTPVLLLASISSTQFNSINSIEDYDNIDIWNII